MGSTISAFPQRRDGAAAPAAGSGADGSAGATEPVATTARTAGNSNISGTYFGPHFLIDPMPTGADGGNQRPLRTTQAFWGEILNVLASGPGATQAELAGFENVYAQLPPADLRQTATIQALVAIQKNTIRIVRAGENAYIVRFDFDSLVPVRVHLFWNARESYYMDEHGQTRIRFQDENGTPVIPWSSNIFPAGLGQSFAMPKDAALDISAMLAKFSPAETTFPMSPTTPRSPFSATSSSVPFNPSPRSATAPPDSSLYNPESASGNPPDLPAGMAGARNDVVVNVEATPTSPTDTRNATHDQSSAATTHPNMFPLCIHIEAEQPPEHKNSQQPTFHSQTIFSTFSFNQQDDCNVKALKQLLMIDGASYLVQDIYGFVEPNENPTNGAASESNSSMKECVVCMSEAKDTIVLPCRHLCLCGICADVLRMQGRPGSTAPARNGPPKCPICRQVFHSLLQVNLPEPFAARDSIASRRRSKASRLSLANDLPAIVDTQPFAEPGLPSVPASTPSVDASRT